MKKLLLSIASFMMLMSSCNSSGTTSDNNQWEYNIVSLKGSNTPKVSGVSDQDKLNKQSAFLSLNFPDDTDICQFLNFHGKEGWELVNVYTTEETVFPNFGEENYHTGIKGNTRTNTINFVFKRIKQD